MRKEEKDAERKEHLSSLVPWQWGKRTSSDLRQINEFKLLLGEGCGGLGLTLNVKGTRHKIKYSPAYYKIAGSNPEPLLAGNTISRHYRALSHLYSFPGISREL